MRAEKEERMSLLKSMENRSDNTTKYTGHFGQFITYLGKRFRLFAFQSDWKVLPMSAVIAAMVSMAVGKGIFQTMEGTFQGTLALSCVCIWNGFFNSIQSICRERAVVKREHRAGLHITSYVMSHVVYQFLLCAAQATITLLVCSVTGMKYPAVNKIEGVDMSFSAELFITLLLVTFAADMLALMISAIVHTEMAAMTVMPFVLIVQLVFSGFIVLPQSLTDVSKLMLSKWGVAGLCIISDYNNLPAVMIWNKMSSSGDLMEIGGGVTVKDVMNIVEEQGLRDTIIQKLGQANARADFASTVENIVECWGNLIIFATVFIVITVVFLEFIDRDKR